MRIVGGSRRGRKIATPASTVTRPMSDRAREALFNILGDVTDFTVLDTYAGSGAIGLEALSRGAKRVIGVEWNRKAAEAIRANVKKLGFEDAYELYFNDVEKWIRDNRTDRFNLIIMAPPFAHFNPDIAEQLVRLLKAEAILVLQYSKESEVPILKNATLRTSRRYGDSGLSFYTKI